MLRKRIRICESGEKIKEIKRGWGLKIGKGYRKMVKELKNKKIKWK